MGKVLVGAVVLGTLALFSPAQGATPPPCLGFQATIVGTDGPDTITGTEGNDVIVGVDGDDYIWGLGGHDILCGGQGKDVIYSHDQAAFDKDCAEEANANASSRGVRGTISSTAVDIWLASRVTEEMICSMGAVVRTMHGRSTVCRERR